MGYDVDYIRIGIRLERHNGPGDKADNEAYERLKQELWHLLDSDPDYRRIAHLV